MPTVFLVCIYALMDLHEDFLLQIIMQKYSLSINNLGLKIPYDHGHQKDSKWHIIHNWGEIIIEVETQSLAVLTCHQLSSKHTISFDLKYPFALDTLTTNRHLGFTYFLPNFAHIHFLKLFINCTSLFSS